MGLDIRLSKYKAEAITLVGIPYEGLISIAPVGEMLDLRS